MNAPVFRAAAWMTGALASFATMAICGKELSADLTTGQIMFWRGLAGWLLIALLLSRSGWGQLRTERIKLHGFRAVVHFGAQFGWFFAIPLIPLAEVFALEFTMPIWAAIMAALFLGERMNGARVIAIALGFVGALVIIRPGVSAVGIGQVSAIAAAVGFAVAATTVRALAQRDTPLCILFYMTAIQLPMGLAAAVHGWVWPDPAAHGPWIVLVGCTAFSAHYCLASAMRLAEATVVVTMDFLRLPLIAVIGYVFYGEALELWVVVGAALVCTGIYTNVRDAAWAKPA